MSKRLENKVCAITGAGQGIGEAGAKLFAAEGAYVFVLELNSEAGRKCVEAITAAGGKAEFIQTDVSNGESVKAAFEQIMAKAGTLDVLYNKHIKLINKSVRDKNTSIDTLVKLFNALHDMFEVFGLGADVSPLKEEELTLVRRWQEARTNKDFELADTLRKQIVDAGIEL